MSLTPPRASLPGIRHALAGLRHGGRARRAGVLEDQRVVRRHVRAKGRRCAAPGPRALRTRRRAPRARTGPAWAAARFRSAPRGARLPKRATRPPSPHDSARPAVRITARVGRVDGRPRQTLPQGLASHGRLVEVEQRRQLASGHGADAAGVRRSPPCKPASHRFQVDQDGRRVRELVQPLERVTGCRGGRRSRSGGPARWSSPRAPAARAARSRPPPGVIDPTTAAGRPRPPSRAASRPAASAQRSRSGCWTAGIAAVVRAGSCPGSARQAMLEAVPDENGAGAARHRRAGPRSRPISSRSSSPRPVARPEAAAVGSQPLAAAAGRSSSGPTTSWTAGSRP